MKRRHERLIHPWSPEHSPLAVPQPDAVAVPLTELEIREQQNAHRRASKRAWGARPETREYHRNWYQENHERELAKNAAYVRLPHVRAHRLELQRRRQRDVLGKVPHDIISLQAREHEQVLVELRREGYSFREIARLTGRPENACRETYRRVAHQHGHPLKSYQPWTPEEDTSLRSHYASASWQTLEKMLPRHSHAAIMARASELCVSRQRRIPDDLVLATYQDGMTWAELARRLGCTPRGARLAYNRSLDRATRPDQQREDGESQ